MAKTITIQISDADYADLVQHLAKDRIGRQLVAVIKDMSDAGSFLKRDVAAAKAEIDARGRS